MQRLARWKFVYGLQNTKSDNNMCQVCLFLVLTFFIMTVKKLFSIFSNKVSLSLRIDVTLWKLLRYQKGLLLKHQTWKCNLCGVLPRKMYVMNFKPTSCGMLATPKHIWLMQYLFHRKYVNYIRTASD